MRDEKLYNQTVDIFLDAYNAGELFHGNCDACAVGNIIKETGGFVKSADGFARYQSSWHEIFCTNINNLYRQTQKLLHDEHNEDAAKEIAQTGYSLDELAKIEYAFETSIFGKFPEGDFVNSYLHYVKVEEKKGQFLGLCAVLRVLAGIHEVEKESQEINQWRLEGIYNKFQEA